MNSTDLVWTLQHMTLSPTLYCPLGIHSIPPPTDRSRDSLMEPKIEWDATEYEGMNENRDLGIWHRQRQTTEPSAPFQRCCIPQIKILRVLAECRTKLDNKWKVCDPHSASEIPEFHYFTSVLLDFFSIYLLTKDGVMCRVIQGVLLVV